jgi:hypothetical protein
MSVIAVLSKIIQNFGLKEIVSITQNSEKKLCKICSEEKFCHFTMFDCGHSSCSDCSDKLTDITDRYEFLFNCPFCHKEVYEVKYRI